MINPVILAAPPPATVGAGITLSIGAVLFVGALFCKFAGRTTWIPLVLAFGAGAAMSGGALAAIILTVASTGLNAVGDVGVVR